MEKVFLAVVNMSVAAGWMILAVAAVRLLLRKAPRRIFCLLWGLVGVRLACPISLESVFSLLPTAQTVSPEIVLAVRPQLSSGVAPVDLAVNRLLLEAAPDPSASVNPLQIWAFVAAAVWLAGVGALVLWGLVSDLRLRRRVREGVPLEGRVWICDRVDTPFLLGIFRPRIILPSSLGEEERPYVLAHEKAHLERRDHWWKPLGWLLLTVHWFNPLCWLAYGLFCRDLELACDQKVVGGWELPRRKAYSQALLACSAPRFFPGGAPLAFGETGVRQRIRAVLENRQAGVWLRVAGAAVCLGVAVCFLTDPPGTGEEPVRSSLGEEGPLAETAGTAARPSREEGETVPLTQETARQCIRETLSTLVVGSDGTVSFTLPETLPTDEAGATRLTITLNATFAPEPGTGWVQSLLDWETRWTGGQTYRGVLDQDHGELTQVMLRVAFMTQAGENQYQEYAAGFLELTAPFPYDTLPAGEEASVSVEGEGGDTLLRYRFQNREGAAISLPLPQGWTAVPGEDAAAGGYPPAVALLREGELAGTFCLYPLGSGDPAVLEEVDPASPQLPMAIFAALSLGNHQGYEGYQVQRSWATGAAAIALWRWQDLTQEGPAAAIPWQETDCVLAYDWAVMPYFAELRTAAPGLLSAGQLEAVAEGLAIRAQGTTGAS